MRKLLRTGIMFFFILISITCFAQEMQVSGRVLSENNPVAGATILVRGTKSGTKTDANGNYSISVKKGDILLITAIGFTSQQIKVNRPGSMDVISLQNASGVLGEVVVTAMDIRKNSRELPYSVQKVSGGEIAGTQRENFVNGLQGRVAGLTVTPTTGTAGASSSIVLRGFNSASLSNQPLFIVDGIIIDNSTFNETSNGGTGIGLASDLPNRNNDYTNRIADINPSDIENITILKGPEATALYGSQASSGAIVITTKKPGLSGRTAITYDNSFRFVKETRFPKLNNDYSPGNSGVPSTNSFSYFGPAYPSDTKRYDNIDNFFQTGFAQTHNLGVDFGKKNVGFRFSSSYFHENGDIPRNVFEKINLRLTNSTKISNFLTITPSISYTNSTNDKPLRGPGGFLLDLYAWPSVDNAANYLDANGHKRLLYATTPTSEILDNPFFSAAKNHSRDRTDRVIATLGIDYHPFSWLNIAGRFGYDTYKTTGYSLYNPESSLLTQAQNGSLDNYYLKYHGYNHTINATATKKLGDFTGHFMVGTMWQDYQQQGFAKSGNTLLDPNGTDSSNSTGGKQVLLRNAFGLPNLSITRQFAYFLEGGISYRNLLFLNVTHRWEAASVFPTANRTYDYPGFGLSAIISDILPFMKAGGVINYAKLRASAASTARIPDPYLNQSVFVNNFASSNIPPYSYGFYNNNPNLKLERQNTYEVGSEFRFLNDRITLDAAYYNTHCLDQISVGFRASYGTGFILNTQNATESRNQGVEIALGFNPVRKQNVNWNIQFNFSHMWSNVIAIPSSIDSTHDYYISDTWLFNNTRGGYLRGRPTTTITGYAYTRNNNGDILIDPTTGLPIVNQNFVPIGDRNPKFNLSMNNNIRFKNWTLSFLWDAKVGGDVFNGTDMYLTEIGRSARTSDRRTPRVISGVLKDGLENSATPTKNTILVTPYYNSAAFYGETTGLPDEEFVQKNVNWLRLRDLTISYAFGKSVIGKVKAIRSLSAFVTASDLILITNYNGADPAVNGNTAGTRGVGAFAFDYGNVATPIGVNFGIRAGF